MMVSVFVSLKPDGMGIKERKKKGSEEDKSSLWGKG